MDAKPKGRALTAVLTLIALAFPTIPLIFAALSPWGSPNVVIVKMCVLLIGMVLCLWFLDATGILSFARPWMSKAIWVVAIAGVLGTALSVFKAETGGNPDQLCGRWRLTVTWVGGSATEEQSRQFELLLVDSDTIGIALGTSRVEGWKITDSIDLNWVEIPRLSTRDAQMQIIWKNNGLPELFDLVVPIRIDKRVTTILEITGSARLGAVDYTFLLRRL